MKRTIAFAALSAILLGSIQTKAQVPVVSKMVPKVTVGIKAGANFQSLSSTTWDNAYKAGFTGGAFVGVTKKKIGVQAEVLVKTCKYSLGSAFSGLGGGDVSSMYLDIPVLFEYKIVPRLWVQLGPQFSDMLSAKSNGNDVKNTFKTSDFSGVIGLQAILPVHLVAGARFVYGFSDINNHDLGFPTDAWNNRSIQIYVGFRLL